MLNVLFVKSYAKDAGVLERLVDSYRQFSTGSIVVATEGDSFGAIANALYAAGGSIVLVDEWLHNALQIADGYCRQQYVKLSLHKLHAYNTRFFVTDSDCQFVASPDYAQLAEDTTTINVAPFEEAGRYNISAPEAAECTKIVLGLDSVRYDYTVYPFWPVDCEVLRALETYLEKRHQKPMWELFRDLWAEKHALSEMNIYGEFARLHFPGAHRLNDVTTSPVHYHFIRHNHYQPVRLTR